MKTVCLLLLVGLLSAYLVAAVEEDLHQDEEEVLETGLDDLANRKLLSGYKYYPECSGPHGYCKVGYCKYYPKKYCGYKKYCKKVKTCGKYGYSYGYGYKKYKKCIHYVYHTKCYHKKVCYYYACYH